MTESDPLDEILNPDLQKYKRGGRRPCIISDLVSESNSYLSIIRTVHEINSLSMEAHNLYIGFKN